MAEDLVAGRLVAPFDVRLKANYAYWFVYPAEVAPNNTLRWVENWIVEQFGECNTEGEA